MLLLTKASNVYNRHIKVTVTYACKVHSINFKTETISMHFSQKTAVKTELTCNTLRQF